MDASALSRAAEALREVVGLIDGESLEATAGQRAYIAGALHGLAEGRPDTQID